jgi:hypothetical protein
MDESTIYKNKAAILDVFYTVLYKNNENISPNPKTLLGVDSNKNPFYYINLIDNFSNVMNEKFLSDSLINNIKEIEKFNYALIDLTKELVNFFIQIYAFDGKDNSVIRLSESNVNQSFKGLSRHILLINSYMSIKDFSTSVDVRDYFLFWTEESIHFLYNNIYLDIEKSSFKVNFDNIILKFKNSISEEEINIREKVKNKMIIKVPLNSKEVKFTLREIALKYIYEDEWIHITNANEIAEEYGWVSGQKLIEYFREYSVEGNRIANDSKAKVKNMIKRIENVMEIIKSDFKEKPQNEITKLKNYIPDY